MLNVHVYGFGFLLKILDNEGEGIYSFGGNKLMLQSALVLSYRFHVTLIRIIFVLVVLTPVKTRDFTERNIKYSNIKITLK